MKYTIYKITNKINGKIYIGKHQTKNPYDGYYGSGKFIRAAIEKYGKENFQKEVLYVFDTESEMNEKEKELITEEFVSRKDTYNAGVGGEGGPHFKGKVHRPEFIDKLKNINLGNKYTEGRVPWNKGKKLPDEIKQKISTSRSGVTHRPEAIEKIKAARAKQIITEETRRKMSESAKNRKKKNISGPVD